MKIITLLAFSAALSVAPAPLHSDANAAVGKPRSTPRNTVLLNPDDIRSVRRRSDEYTGVVKRCTGQLGYEAAPVAVFAPDPHYTASGVNTTANNAKQLSADSQAAYRLALCHLLTGDRRFAQTSQRILDAWSGTLKSVTTVQGKGDINFNVPYMIAAASWVRGANGWNSASFDRFLKVTAIPNSTSENPNNHGMWGVFMEASAGAYLGDATLLETARRRWGEILRGATSSDGTLIREIERSGTTNWRGGPDKGAKGIAYTHYFLLPASMAAKVFADQRRPIWRTAEGDLLGAAFRRAAHWTIRPETFPFYASNNGKLEGVRSGAYFPLLLRFYKSPDAEAAMRQSSPGDGGFMLPLLFSGKPR